MGLAEAVHLFLAFYAPMQALPTYRRFEVVSMCHHTDITLRMKSMGTS